MPAADKLDPYAVLGIARSASAAEIRAAYRALVARYHPDLHHGNPLEQLAGERMAEINQAYELLSDPRRRAAFDKHGVDAGTGAGARQNAGADPSAPPARGTRMPAMAKWALLALLIAALPLLVRGAVALVRAVMGIEGETLGLLASVRGTPVGLALASLAVALLAWSLWRRRRKRRRAR